MDIKALKGTDGARPMRIALFSGNYNYTLDGANKSLNRLVGHLQAFEDVRVARDQLVADAARHVLDIERRIGVVLGDPGVEHHLQQDVAELLPQVRPIAGLDRLDQLVRLLDRVRGQGGMGLFGVPRASAR